MGLTIQDTGELMKNAGCVDAINLDGGGSSALYAVVDGKIRLPYMSLKGVGETAAMQLENSCKENTQFLSVEDFQKASGASSSVIDTLYEVGALGDMPRTNQVSFFMD